MSGKAAIYFSGVGFFAAIAVLFPGAVLIGFFLMIVPGVLLLIAPSLFIYSLIAYCIWVSTPALEKRFRFLAVAAAWTGFAVLPPIYYNVPTEKLRAQLRADDVALAGAPLRGDTIAILTPDRKLPSRDDLSACDMICLRLLYNGAAARVIRDDQFPERAGSPLRAFRLEQRERCPAPGTLDETWVPGERADFADLPADRIRLRMAAGDCLIAESARLSEADIVMVDKELRAGEYTIFARPWDLRLNTVSARRVEITRAAGSDAPIVYRRTEVASEPLVVPFTVGPVPGGGIKFTSGFVRWLVLDNQFKLETAAAEAFGDGMRQPDRIGDDAYERKLLVEALRDRSLSADDARFALADRVLKRIFVRGPGGPDERAADLSAMRLMIQDRRVAAFTHLPGAVAKLEAEADSLIGPMLDRLMLEPLPDARDIVRSISHAISRLPPRALVQYVEKLETLARTPSRRGTAYLASSRLADEGADAVPKLLALIEARKSFDKLQPFDDERDVVLAGLIGLCRLGPDAIDAQAPLVAFIREQHMHEPRKRLAIEALVRSGGREAALDALGDIPKLRETIEREAGNAAQPRAFGVCQY